METVGLLKKTGEKEKHKGRELTPKAESMIAQAIKSLDKSAPAKEKKSAPAKKEE